MENKENLSRKQRKIKRKKEEIEKKQSDNKRLRYTVFTLIGLALFIFYLASIPFNLVTKSQAKRTKDIAIIKPETKEEAIVKDEYEIKKIIDMTQSLKYEKNKEKKYDKNVKYMILLRDDENKVIAGYSIVNKSLGLFKDFSFVVKNGEFNLKEVEDIFNKNIK